MSCGIRANVIASYRICNPTEWRLVLIGLCRGAARALRWVILQAISSRADARVFPPSHPAFFVAHTA